MKVIVTTTTAQLTIPYIMLNYNGGQKSQEYNI
jgi:hypothetical protein